MTAVASKPTRRRAPRSMVTSKNCISLPASNTHTFRNGVTINAGEEMVFDLDRCPAHGDLVLIWGERGSPYVRCCHIPPAPMEERSRWAMGVLDSDGETIVMIDLGKYERVGVMTGTLPSIDG
jgi:hypothetical protein